MESEEQKQEEMHPADMTKKERREARRLKRLEQEHQQLSVRNNGKMLKWLGIFVFLALVVWGISTRSGSFEDRGEPVAFVGDIQLYEHEWEQGNPEALVTIVEYSDLQCPACKSFAPTVSRLMEMMGDDVRFVYRHFPLRSIHSNAQLAAQATEAAGQQGKFFELHDILFERQNDWSSLSKGDAEDRFVSYAEELGLDVDAFTSYMKSFEAKSAVDNDYASGAGLGVNSTPSFYVNGDKIANSPNFESFRAVIAQYVKDAEIAAQINETHEEASGE